MNQSNKLKADYSIDENRFILSYCVDNTKGIIIVSFPFSLLNFQEIIHEYFAIACTVLIAGLALPKKITLGFNFHQNDLFESLLNNIYDTISNNEKYESMCKPDIIYSQRVCEKFDFEVFEKSAILSSSGGVDSTFSLLLLKKNKYDVQLMHSNINQTQSESEFLSVSKISKYLGNEFQFISIDFKDMIELGKSHIYNFAKYPDYNCIPYGRDIVHIFAALYFCIKYKASTICLGHEFEVWKYFKYYKDRKIYPTELQSEHCNFIVEKILKNLNKNLCLLSPIGAISKLRICSEFLKYDTHLFNLTNSCFFSKKSFGNCGKCSNCIMYDCITKTIKGDSNMIEFELFIKRSENSTIFHLYSSTYYFIYFEEIQRLINDESYKYKLLKLFGKDIGKSKVEIFNELMSFHKIDLIPDGFNLNLMEN